MLRLLLGELEVSGAEMTFDAVGVDRQATIRLRGAADALVELDWSYGHGELKDVLVETRDGREHRADMLDGFHAFKSSLYHEYEEILRDFARTIAGGEVDARRGPDGAAISRQVRAAYDLARAGAASA